MPSPIGPSPGTAATAVPLRRLDPDAAPEILLQRVGVVVGPERVEVGRDRLSERLILLPVTGEFAELDRLDGHAERLLGEFAAMCLVGYLPAPAVVAEETPPLPTE